MLSFRHRVGRALVVLLVVQGMLPAAAAGQANYARPGGTVSDPSGGVLTGASIVLRNVRTNGTQETISDGQGRFNFAEVPIGQYELTVTLQGFQKLVRSDITPDGTGRGSRGRALDTVVEVTGGIPLIQTATSSVQTSMTERQVQELPLNGRNPLQLVALTAGAAITDAGVPDAYLPLPNAGSNLLVLQNRDIDDEQYTGRADWMVSPANQISMRYFDDDNQFQRPFTAPNGFYAANDFRNLQPERHVTAGANFGRVLAAYDPRVFQFGAKLQF